MVPFVILIVVVMRAAAIMIPVPIILVVAMMFVPTAMQATVMMAITVLISIIIPVTVVVPIAVSVLDLVAIPVAVTNPGGAAVTTRRNARIRGIGGDTVMRIDILHAPFHADDFAAIVGSLIVLPARVITVKPALIA